MIWPAYLSNLTLWDPSYKFGSRCSKLPAASQMHRATSSFWMQPSLSLLWRVNYSSFLQSHLKVPFIKHHLPITLFCVLP